MNNIFQIGGMVEGESFIGREKLMDNLKHKYIETPGRINTAIVGLTRTGKSSVAYNLFKNLPDNVLYIYENLKEHFEYSQLWQSICLSIKKYLKKHDLMSEDMAENLKCMQDEDISWIELTMAVKEIFEELADMQIKTILVLDEFDHATDLFEAGTPKGTAKFELFRTIFSDAKYDVSAMTISRRNLHTIEGTTYQSSTFHGVLDLIPLKGFDDADMDAYYKVFGNFNIELSEEQKESIEYYAGRSPYLLSIMGHYIVEAVENGEPVDITGIFLNKCKAINDYYRDCIRHLERDDDLKRIVPFVIGPNVGVTKNDKDELINLGYLREDDDKIVAISDYFANFLSANMLQINIWDNIINLEKKMKGIIEHEFANIVDHYQVGGESIDAVQRNVLETVKEITRGDINRYDSFIKNSSTVFNIQSSYLDVMSMNDSFLIIKECWDDIFSKYFNYDLYSNWSYKFDKCTRARNPIAHGHEEYLTDLDKNEIDTYCKQIFDTLANSAVTDSPSDEEKVLLTAAKYASSKPVEPDQYETPLVSLIGQEVDLLVLKRGAKNNLTGVIQGKYRGTIPKNCLVGIDLDSMIGETLKVTIEKIEKTEGGDRYLVNYEKDTTLSYSIGDKLFDLVAATKIE